MPLFTDRNGRLGGGAAGGGGGGGGGGGSMMREGLFILKQEPKFTSGLEPTGTSIQPWSGTSPSNFPRRWGGSSAKALARGPWRTPQPL